MKTKLKLRLLLLLLMNAPVLGHAQGTAINYQGRLVENGQAANGPYDFLFTLYDSDMGGNVLRPPVPLGAVPVVAGQFAASLDFGPAVFTGQPRWVQIGVRRAGAGNYITLAPMQALLPTPYAIYAASAGAVASGTVTANQLNTGGILPASGQFLSYAGGNLVWSDPAVAAGNIWSLNGLDTYFNTGKVGIGTLAPATPLEVNGIVRTTRSNVSGQYIQLDGGDPAGIRLTANSVLSAEKSLSIQNLSGEAAPGANNNIQFVLGTPATPSTKMTITKDGNVVIPLGGSGGSMQLGTPNFETGMSIVGSNRADIRFDGSSLKLVAGPGGAIPPGQNGIIINTAGNVGIGSPTPQAKLEIVSQDALRLVGYQPFLTLLDSNAGYARSRIQGVNGDIVLEPESFVSGSNPSASVTISGSGNVSVKSLTIRGGADLAEPFEVSVNQVPKGSVMIIDPENAGKLKLSDQAYDRRVAGVVSGAFGINPGIALHQEGALDRGQNVALSGRVYVLADAGYGEINPGDLLTTSSTAGHAMKVVDHARAQGAILGKAMSALKGGKGAVLLLVTLQ